MIEIFKSEKKLKIFLILIALHTFLIGVALIILPADLFSIFGYNNLNEPFFAIQAGVFHIVLSIGYIVAVNEKCKERYFLQYIILIKFIAFVFLILYYLIAANIPVIILSAIIDLILGILLLMFYLKLKGVIKNEK